MKPIAFLDVLVAVASLNLKVPITLFVQNSLPCLSLSRRRILVYIFCLISIGLSLSFSSSPQDEPSGLTESENVYSLLVSSSYRFNFDRIVPTRTKKITVDRPTSRN